MQLKCSGLKGLVRVALLLQRRSGEGRSTQLNDEAPRRPRAHEEAHGNGHHATKERKQPAPRPHVAKKRKRGVPADFRQALKDHFQMDAPDSKKSYVTSLDGLRAICCAAVVLYHMGLSWMQGGLLGVTVLFVLSGYLATVGLLHELDREQTIHVGRYYAKRAWRLMPTALAYILVTAALCTIFSHPLLTKMRPDIVPSIFMFLNWAKIFTHQSYFAAQGAPSPLTHFWSLAIEAQFYIVWPLILIAMEKAGWPRKRMRYVTIGLAAVSAALMAITYVPGQDPSRSYYGTDTRAMSLLVGAWLAFVWPIGERSRQQMDQIEVRGKGIGIQLKAAGPTCVAALVVLMVATNGYSSFSYYGGILLVSVIAAGAIAALIPQGSAFNCILGARPLRWIGQRSYAIYVWHFIILELLNPRNATGGLPWWKIALELLLVLAVADLSYTFIETPLKNGWPKRSRWGSEPKPVSLRSLIRHHRAAAIACAATLAVAILGCALVPSVTVAGDNPEDKVLTKTTLRKPLEEGKYDVVLIGDSVSLGAHDNLSNYYPHGLIDTEGNRQWSQALDVYKTYRDKGVVGDIVIFSVGTNAYLTDENIDTIMAEVGSDKQVWFVNLRGPYLQYDTSNEAIEQATQRYSNVHLIDWHAATEGHSEYLIEDGIHLTWEGRDAFAKLVYDTVGYTSPTDADTKYAVTLISDSSLLNAANTLADAQPQWMIDAADVRSGSDAVQDLKSNYADQGVLGPAVVLNVGADGPLQESDLDGALSLLGDGQTLYLVTERNPTGWCESNNALMKSFADAHDNVQLIDWYAASDGHDDWFEADGITLSDAGAAAYTQLLTDSIPVQDASAETQEDGDSGESSADESGASETDDGTSATSSVATSDGQED